MGKVKLAVVLRSVGYTESGREWENWRQSAVCGASSRKELRCSLRLYRVLRDKCRNERKGMEGHRKAYNDLIIKKLFTGFATSKK